MTPESIRPMLASLVECCEAIGGANLMEVCGTHTVSLFRSGLKSLLPESLNLISGPGCPVCVTSQGYIDAACELSRHEGVTVATYGDMLRVPGESGSLEQHKAAGGRVLVTYSARDALNWARAHPDRQVVFLAVGFETTAPATAATLIEADQAGVENFFILPGHKLVIPAMRALLAEGEVGIDGFMCPGHVSVIIGSAAYEPIAREYRKPCVVAGFEPANMLAAIVRLAEMIRENRCEVDNVYPVAVGEQGNPAGRALVDRVFQPDDETWRAMGELPDSGLSLRDPYRRFDARDALGVTIGPDACPPGCRCGEVIQGKLTPADCSLFAQTCTPAHPVGPCMVSSEGTCAAWYKYRR